MPPEKLVKDLMRPLKEYPCVQEQDSLREAMEVMRHRVREGKPLCLLVTGEGSTEKGVIKGSISARDLVFGLSGNFLKGARRSGAIFWEGQFELECLEGVKKSAGEIMMPFKGCVRETEMLMEAVFLMNKFGLSYLPVIHEDEVTGLIHLEDILEEIGRVVVE